MAEVILSPLLEVAVGSLEFEWKPNACSVCKTFLHKEGTCQTGSKPVAKDPGPMSQPISNSLLVNSEQPEPGWRMVHHKNRRKANKRLADSAVKPGHPTDNGGSFQTCNNAEDGSKSSVSEVEKCGDAADCSDLGENEVMVGAADQVILLGKEIHGNPGLEMTVSDGPTTAENPSAGVPIGIDNDGVLPVLATERGDDRNVSASLGLGVDEVATRTCDKAARPSGSTLVGNQPSLDEEDASRPKSVDNFPVAGMQSQPIESTVDSRQKMSEFQSIFCGDGDQYIPQDLVEKICLAAEPYTEEAFPGIPEKAPFEPAFRAVLANREF